MKKIYKLKGWVVSSIYICSMAIILISGILFARALKSSTYNTETLSYVYRGLVDDGVYPVINYQNEKIIKPFDNNEVTVLKNFYDKDSSTETQENSLILYQNTYMPNTGILYSYKDVFDVLSVLDGNVESIVADEMMGNIVTVKHSNNLLTVYECLNEVNVLVGDVIKQGEVLGNSGSNKIDSSSENMLLFEVIYNGEYLNPNNFYEMNLDELN